MASLLVCYFLEHS